MFLSPFVQALPLLFDSESAFEDVELADSEMRSGVHDGFPESLHLLVGFDDDGSVRSSSMGEPLACMPSASLPRWSVSLSALGLEASPGGTPGGSPGGSEGPIGLPAACCCLFHEAICKE